MRERVLRAWARWFEAVKGLLLWAVGRGQLEPDDRDSYRDSYRRVYHLGESIAIGRSARAVDTGAIALGIGNSVAGVCGAQSVTQPVALGQPLIEAVPAIWIPCHVPEHRGHRLGIDCADFSGRKPDRFSPFKGVDLAPYVTDQPAPRVPVGEVTWSAQLSLDQRGLQSG